MCNLCLLLILQRIKVLTQLGSLRASQPCTCSAKSELSWWSNTPWQCNPIWQQSATWVDFGSVFRLLSNAMRNWYRGIFVLFLQPDRRQMTSWSSVMWPRSWSLWCLWWSTPVKHFSPPLKKTSWSWLLNMEWRYVCYCSRLCFNLDMLTLLIILHWANFSQSSQFLSLGGSALRELPRCCGQQSDTQL